MAVDVCGWHWRVSLFAKVWMLSEKSDSIRVGLDCGGGRVSTVGILSGAYFLKSCFDRVCHIRGKRYTKKHLVK